jgi:hypothetical protein
LSLYQHDKKVFESPSVRANRLSEARDGTVPVWFQLPVSKIAPGNYQCQVTLIDEFGRKFAFPRTRLAVLPESQASKQGETSPSSTSVPAKPGPPS